MSFPYQSAAKVGHNEVDGRATANFTPDGGTLWSEHSRVEGTREMVEIDCPESSGVVFIHEAPAHYRMRDVFVFSGFAQCLPPAFVLGVVSLEPCI